MEGAQPYAVNVIGPGFTLILRVAGADEVEIRDRFADLMRRDGMYQGEKDVVRFGPAMYVNVIGPWDEYEARRKKQQEAQAAQQQRMLEVAGAVPGGGPRIVMPVRG